MQTKDDRREVEQGYRRSADSKAFNELYDMVDYYKEQYRSALAVAAMNESLYNQAMESLLEAGKRIEQYIDLIGKSTVSQENDTTE